MARSSNALAESPTVKAIACQVGDRVLFGGGQLGQVKGFENIDTEGGSCVRATVRVSGDDGQMWMIPGFAEVIRLSGVDVGVSESCVTLIRQYGLGFELGSAVHEIVTSTVAEDRLSKLTRAQWFLTREIERLRR